MSLGFRLRLFVATVVLLVVPFAIVDALLHGDRPPATILPLGIGAAVVIALVLSALSSRWLAREVRPLGRAARRMAEGDLHVRTRAAGSHEVAQLGVALDVLGASFSAAMNDLRAERDLVAGILDGMQEGVLLLDRYGRIRRVNPTFRDVFLVSLDVVGRPLSEVVRHAPLLEMLDAARVSGKARNGEIEVPGLRPRRLLVRAAPLAADTQSLLTVFVDVTDLRRLESLRRDFVANVSHELRTPVTAVLSAAETLSGGALEDPTAAAKFLDIIARNTKRLRALVDDLLDLSRIEAKQFQLRPESIELASAFQHVLGVVRERAERQRVTLTHEVDPAARVVVTDRRALDQVLVNLVENAVKYCPGAAVKLVAAPREGGGVTLRIADTGPGIEARHLDRIFERFYRVDPGRSRELGGTGLGLSIVKHLVEAMRGAVAVASTVGKGTTFTIELP